MSSVIQVTNLSKIYRLGEIGTGTISHDLERWYKMKIRGQEDPFLKIGETNERNKKGASDVVYSLKDINFEVEQGEALGIIGKNGAGKSTLLKIISRVTSPTTGKINIKGRVASLLEVGTGFHPELTGRENIYLNGAILGMRKKEIARKLDEIVDFSGVERYLDTPVKRYSSGMYVRLAFAVAAHLESEIMIVDEVLAVGDAEFQKKCLGKMGNISQGEGRTVLFVSHNMGAIRNLCNKSALIENGSLKMISQTENVIKTYLSIEHSFISYVSSKTDSIFLQSAKLNNEEDIITDVFDFNSNISILLNIHLDEIPIGLCVTIALQNIYKNRIFSVDLDLSKYSKSLDNILEIKFICPKLPYAPGNYSIIVGLHIPNNLIFEIIEDILPFTIIDKGSDLSRYNAFQGDMLIEGSWKVLK